MEIALFAFLKTGNFSILSNVFFYSILKIYPPPEFTRNILYWPYIIYRWIGIMTTFGYKFIDGTIMQKAVVPFLSLIIQNEDLKNIFFTFLFGHPSFEPTRYNGEKAININMWRDQFEVSLTELLDKSKKDGIVNTDLLNKNIMSQIGSILISFFIFFLESCQQFMDAFSHTLMPFEFKAYNEYKNKYNDKKYDIKKGMYEAFHEYFDKIPTGKCHYETYRIHFSTFKKFDTFFTNEKLELFFKEVEQNPVNEQNGIILNGYTDDALINSSEHIKLYNEKLKIMIAAYREKIKPKEDSKAKRLLMEELNSENKNPHGNNPILNGIYDSYMHHKEKSTDESAYTLYLESQKLLFTPCKTGTIIDIAGQYKCVENVKLYNYGDQLKEDFKKEQSKYQLDKLLTRMSELNIQENIFTRSPETIRRVIQRVGDFDESVILAELNKRFENPLYSIQLYLQELRRTVEFSQHVHIDNVERQLFYLLSEIGKKDTKEYIQEFTTFKTTMDEMLKKYPTQETFNLDISKIKIDKQKTEEEFKQEIIKTKDYDYISFILSEYLSTENKKSLMELLYNSLYTKIPFDTTSKQLKIEPFDLTELWQVPEFRVTMFYRLVESSFHPLPTSFETNFNFLFETNVPGGTAYQSLSQSTDVLVEDAPDKYSLISMLRQHGIGADIVLDENGRFMLIDSLEAPVAVKEHSLKGYLTTFLKSYTFDLRNFNPYEHAALKRGLEYIGISGAKRKKESKEKIKEYEVLNEDYKKGIQQLHQRHEPYLKNVAPPILIDPYCNLKETIEKKSKYVVTSYSSEFLTKNYEQITTTVSYVQNNYDIDSPALNIKPSSSNACVWILKKQLSYYNYLFSNFNKNEFATHIIQTINTKNTFVKKHFQQVALGHYDERQNTRRADYNQYTFEIDRCLPEEQNFVFSGYSFDFFKSASLEFRNGKKVKEIADDLMFDASLPISLVNIFTTKTAGVTLNCKKDNTFEIDFNDNNIIPTQGEIQYQLSSYASQPKYMFSSIPKPQASVPPQASVLQPSPLAPSTQSIPDKIKFQTSETNPTILAFSGTYTKQNTIDFPWYKLDNTERVLYYRSEPGRWAFTASYENAKKGFASMTTINTNIDTPLDKKYMFFDKDISKWRETDITVQI
jgi:hypothetical protein